MTFQSKKYSPCLNCGKQGHEQKSCPDPITSWGILLIKTNKNVSHETMMDLVQYDKYDGIMIDSKSDLPVLIENINNIHFLLVRRKHSIGFAEFVRGRYTLGNINGLRSLFNQMTPEEIEFIKEKTFDEIWAYFWGESLNDGILNKKDYVDARDKFTKLKSRSSVELDLDFYISTAQPMYNSPEWGFPKGRKKRGEADLECAVREFYEETGFCESDIKILTNIKPIYEDLIGTNGVKYRHIYFLAELISNKEPKIVNTSQFAEIGDIGFFQYNDCMTLLRDYHVEKKTILKKILNYYVESVKNDKLEDENEWYNDKDEFC
jgi:8-oxo-dGTP pyrophosphatase MutT (NUDIX family)